MTDRRLAPNDHLLLASHNQGKLREFQQLFAQDGITILSAADRNLPEPEETATTFAGNAELKARAAAETSGMIALADDSGLCVSALNGAPGVYSARWGGPTRDFDAAMQRVQTERGTNPDASAWFETVLCIAWPDGTTRFFTGRCDGTLAWPPRGTHGHGYDPIFIPEGETRTFAEMDAHEKNAVSHRARALALFRDACLPKI